MRCCCRWNIWEGSDFENLTSNPVHLWIVNWIYGSQTGPCNIRKGTSRRQTWGELTTQILLNSYLGTAQDVSSKLPCLLQEVSQIQSQFPQLYKGGPSSAVLPCIAQVKKGLALYHTLSVALLLANQLLWRYVSSKLCWQTSGCSSRLLVYLLKISSILLHICMWFGSWYETPRIIAASTQRTQQRQVKLENV